jgi:NADPH:quinone reductase-like Zn-dependent oxidoreductase
VLGATGGLASVFPGVAKALGVARVVGAVSSPTRVEAAGAVPTLVLPLEEAARAHRLLETRAVAGKLVLDPEPGAARPPG